jgi:two-component sensor histidine kinase
MSDDETSLGRIAELEADNRRLRRLLDQGGAPDELRHRLRNTLALLRTIVRKSARLEPSDERFAAHFEGRLNAIARAQALSDDFGSVRLSTLLADELLTYGVSEGARAEFSGPEVLLQARAGQVLALAVHELAINAVEHGGLGGGFGAVRIAWTVENEGDRPVLEMVWEERGPAGPAPIAHRGFGLEVLTRMLPYQLHASTHWDVGAEGARFTMRLPLPPDVGNLA